MSATVEDDAPFEEIDEQVCALLRFPELVAFVRCVRDDEDPEPSGEEGVADLRVLDAIARSLERGRPERVVATPRGRRPSKAQAVTRPAHGMPPLVHAEPPGED